MTDSNKPGVQNGAPDTESLVPEADEILTAADDSGSLDEAEDELRRDLEETRQGMLRALADAENVRRRASRDVADARAYAITGFARDLLSVADNFHRALATVEGMDSDTLPAELKGLLDGVRMTERELMSVFERHGVKVIDPMGERFDPNRHQAMFEVENADVASGTVVQVVQKGSVIGERVLRPAMVGISKGGPKPGDKPSDPEQTAEGGAAA